MARDLAPDVVIRRVRPDDWPRTRALRIEALHDPLASVAFLETVADAEARPDAEWQRRASEGSDDPAYAQFLAIRGDDLIGSLAVIVRRAGVPDYFQRIPEVDLPTVVGVYVSPSGRGLGVIDALLARAAEFARARGDAELTLDVHESNAAAIGAYRRSGFEVTGEYRGEQGIELGMVRNLAGKSDSA